MFTTSVSAVSIMESGDAAAGAVACCMPLDDSGEVASCVALDDSGGEALEFVTAAAGALLASADSDCDPQAASMNGNATKAAMRHAPASCDSTI